MCLLLNGTDSRRVWLWLAMVKQSKEKFGIKNYKKTKDDLF
jgi:hypothetical protein